MKIIAHRGACIEAPENTLAAFSLAVAIGADGIECDIQQTLDGQLVVRHDPTLERTTNGFGLVVENTWASVSELNAGSWFAPEFLHERVPLLSEVLVAIGSLECELELKGYGRSFLDCVLRFVDDTDTYNRVEFTSSNLLLLARLKSLRPHARIGLFNKRPEPHLFGSAFEHHILGTAETSGADVIHVYAGAVTNRIVERLHDGGFVVHANDADSADLVRRAIECGADRLTTNDVRTAVGVRVDMLG
jgi:glycerophosphoryl diester phosphodiesterase